MIIIWDNGQPYSDHVIHFINCGPDVDAAALLAVLARAPAPHKVLATAESLDWRAADKMMTPAELAADLRYTGSYHASGCDHVFGDCKCWMVDLCQLVGIAVW